MLQALQFSTQSNIIYLVLIYPNPIAHNQDMSTEYLYIWRSVAYLSFCFFFFFGGGGISNK